MRTGYGAVACTLRMRACLKCCGGEITPVFCNTDTLFRIALTIRRSRLLSKTRLTNQPLKFAKQVSFGDKNGIAAFAFPVYRWGGKSDTHCTVKILEASSANHR